MSSNILTGIVASPGIRIGNAYIYHGIKIVIPKYNLKDSEIEDEIQRFEKALAKTKEEIKAIQEQIADNMSSETSDIFISHLMMLEDPEIVKRAKKSVLSEKRNIEWVLNDIALSLIKNIGSIEDEYMRERILDISDIHKRLIANLQKLEHESLADLKEEVIVFADELTPSDTAIMNKDNVLGFVTNTGGRTSHTAILARALEIPAVVGTMNATSIIRNGDRIILDAVDGKIIVNPDESEIKKYVERQQEILLKEMELSKLSKLPAVTLDGVKIELHGNIELPEEMEMIKNHGADGIGLFRSEFLFLDNHLPGEEKQFQAYKKVVEFFNPKPVIIRTIDVGGDKIFGMTKNYKERNPFLGCRAIRFSLNNIDLFKTQLRAILRASVFGNVKLMFPMISTTDEMVKSKEILEECMAELADQKIDFDSNMKVGAMMEVPSAVINADIISEHSDFFSVGTNDLIQYTLAVDRIGEKVAYLYNPVDLSILRLLRNLQITCSHYNKPLSICGEMAGEPLYTMVLLGLGFRTLSMSYLYMYQIKKIIRSVKISDCEDLVGLLMGIARPSDCTSYLQEYFYKKFPDLANKD